MRALLLLLFAPMTFACLVEKPLSQSEMNKADAVFVGEIEKIADAPKYKAKLVTFAVKKMVRGASLGPRVEVYWLNGVFGETDSVAAFKTLYGQQSEVGILLPETIRNSTKCDMMGRACATRVPVPVSVREDESFDKPWILGDVCSRAFVFKFAK